VAPAITLVSCSAYSSALKMEAICSSETSVETQRTTRRYIPEDGTLHNHRCENLNSYTIKVDLKEIRWEGGDWIQLAQGDACEHVNEPAGSLKGGEFVDYLSN
jgi:hypothetical protein